MSRAICDDLLFLPVTVFGVLEGIRGMTMMTVIPGLCLSREDDIYGSTWSDRSWGLYTMDL